MPYNYPSNGDLDTLSLIIMKITFLTPPPLDTHSPAERTAGCTRLVYPMPNIYELIVAGLLERENHQVYYKDCVQEGVSEQGLEEYLRQDQSECYVIWSVNLSLETDIRTIAKIRATRGDTWVVLLGPGTTYYTRKGLTDERVIVVRGEPELTTVELFALLDAHKPWRHIKGISYLSEGHAIHNPSRELIKDLDLLPFPARHFIEQFPYSNPKLKLQPYTTLLTSRNCPFQCIYCVPSSLTFAREIEYKQANGKKPPVSMRSVANVLEELELLATKGYKAIGIIDDNFITTAKRLRPICEGLKKHQFVWGCQARVDAITEEVAQLLSESNCMYVDLGVESFNDEILHYIKKGITSQQIYEGINLLKKYNVPVKLNILIGTSPLETVETVKETFRQAQALGVSQVMFNIVAPFPGTEFYDMAKENGWIVGGDYTPTDVQHNSILNYPNLSSKEMERLLFRNNLLFFLRPSFMWRHLRQFNSLSDFSTALKALKRKLFH